MLESLIDTYKILAISLGISFLIWYAQFHWNRRHLYKLASKIHGPLALPFIGSAYHFLGSPEKIHEKIATLAKNYPGVVRIWFGTKLVFGVQEPKDIEIIFNNSKTLEKADFYKIMEKGIGQGLFTAQVPTWKQNRKMINPTFNQKNLDSFVEVFAENTLVLIENLKKYCGKGEFDAYKEISNFTLETICESAMGIKLNVQTNGSQFGEWIEHLSEIYFRKMSVIVYQFDIIYKFTKYHKLEKECTQNVHNFITDVILKKKLEYEKTVDEKVPRQRPFLERLFELKFDGQIISENQIRDEVSTFIAGGLDTTATVITFTLLTLAMFPDVQQKAFEEIIDVLGPDRDVNSSDLPNLKYIERVIKETLRLFPVAIGNVRNIYEDIKLDSCTLPANSMVFLAIQAVHLNEKYWPDPYKFDPDRFLPEITQKRHAFAYVPFGVGPRNCIGRKYGMMSMKTVLAGIIRKYTLSTTYKKIVDVRIKSHVVLRPCDGYKISINIRK